MQQVDPDLTPRGPAPSRLSYRMTRLWMRPLVRMVVRLGGPVALVAGTVVWIAADEQRMQMVTDPLSDLRRTIEDRPEFQLRTLAVDGATPDLANAVRETAAVRLPVSSFDLDLDDVQARVEALNAVRQATVRVRPGGVLHVEIDEREPALLWRTAEGLHLLDATGHHIAMARARDAWPDLPVIAGAGAEDAAAEAVSLFRAAHPLRDRLRGLERRGERRWDVVLDRNQRILLPADHPVPALERVIAMAESRHRLLDRDLLAIDLRNPDRPTLRLTDHARHELAVMRGQAVRGTFP